MPKAFATTPFPALLSTITNALARGDMLPVAIVAAVIELYREAGGLTRFRYWAKKHGSVRKAMCRRAIFCRQAPPHSLPHADSIQATRP